jgi:hypothetical protein
MFVYVSHEPVLESTKNNTDISTVKSLAQITHVMYRQISDGLQCVAIDTDL